MSALQCPCCGHAGCLTKDTRQYNTTLPRVNRRRECEKCGARFTTIEEGAFDQNTWADAKKIDALKRRQLTPEEEARLLSRALDSLGEIVMQEGVLVPRSYRQQHADALVIARRCIDN